MTILTERGELARLAQFHLTRVEAAQDVAERIVHLAAAEIYGEKLRRMDAPSFR